MGPPPTVTTSTWHKINYLLNHKSAYYWWNVEVAINRLVGGPAPNDPLNVPPPLPANFPPVDTNEVNAILADVSANAASWTRRCGDIVGVIFVMSDPTLGVPVQLIMLEVSCKCPECDGQIGDFVWNDSDGDGCQDANEAGIAGVTVNLYAGCGVSGSPIKTTTTDSTGHYLFDDLCAGTYTVSFNTPAGYARTTANAGCNVNGKPADETDSDCNCAAGTSCGVCVTLPTANSVDMSVDCGYVCDGQIGDLVWNDSNGNGCQDANEEGIEGVTVNLYAGCGVSGTPIKTMTTDNTGHYLFDDLCVGTYTVSFNTPAGYTRTTANAGCNINGNPADEMDSDCDCAAGISCGICVTLTAVNPMDMSVDCGYVCDGRIGDLVWNDSNGNGCQDANEAGIGGVTVNLYADCGVSGTPIKTVTTDSTGHYLFSGLCIGEYTVSFNTPAGYMRTTANAGCNINGNPPDEMDSDCDCAAGISCGICVTLTAANPVDMSVDCGYSQPASMGDFVWNDTNANGIQDAGEPGIPGVTVELMDCKGNVLATTTTDATGLYVFSGLNPGDYNVHFVMPAGYVFSPRDQGTDDAKDSDANPATGQTLCTTLVSGENDLTWDAGLYQPASLGDFVWNDTNANGIQDAGEPGIPGVTVELMDCRGKVLATTTTDAHGLYVFSGLNPGDYNVHFVMPAGYVFSPRDQGTDDAKDSDANPATGQTLCTTLVSGENDLTWDAGLYQPASLGDFVWNDTNANGIQDAGEPGIPGVTVELMDCRGKVLATTTTDAHGLYVFSGLNPGDYNVHFVMPAGYVFSPMDQGSDDAKDSDVNSATGQTLCTTLVSGENDLTWDAGLYQTTSLGDFVWNDTNANGIQDAGEPGIRGVTVELMDCKGKVLATTTTDANGLYLFSGLNPGDYNVHFVMPAGYVFSPADQGADDAKDSDANPTTGQTLCTTLVPGENDLTWDAGLYQSASLGDFVWNDTNANGIQDAGEPGIPGVTVELMDCKGKVLATTTTDAHGLYVFSGLNPGDYNVHFVMPAGYVFSPRDQGTDDAKDSDANPATGQTLCTTLVSGENDLTWDAGLYQSASLGDFVWNDTNANGIQDAGEPGIPGVTVELMDCKGKVLATTTTDAKGLYLFSGLNSGDYNVHFVMPGGYVLSPMDQGSDDAKDSDVNSATGQTLCTTLAPGENDLTWDAGLYQPASMGDFVWNDTNANGIQDAGEPGIPGVTVELMDCKGNVLAKTITDANGLYLFSGLKPGDYNVYFVVPAGYVFSPMDQGSDDAKDSDANPATGQTLCTTLVPGENDLTWDAGLYQPASLGDFVWNDTNANGIQDAGEPGVRGVTVELMDCKGKVLATTTTDVNGLYLFSELKPGDYNVHFVIPTSYVFSPMDQGADDAKDSDANPATGQTLCTTLVPGENDTTWDVGLFYQPASLGDFVWNDTNANGIQDAGEPGIPGVTVELMDCKGKVLATTTTDAKGLYLFSGLNPGDYNVHFVIPVGYVLSPMDQGMDDTKDSDANPITGQTLCTTLVPGENDLSWDAGLYQPASMGDFIWQDSNANGVQDSDELGIAGATVILTDCNGNPVTDINGNSVNSITTDSSGAYSFTNLKPGQYQVTVTLPGGYVFTQSFQGGDATKDSNMNPATGKSDCRTLSSGQDDDTVDAGAYQPASMGDFIWQDSNANGVQDSGEPGIAGATVTLTDCSDNPVTDITGNPVGLITTGPSGAYRFTNLKPGQYQVTVTLPGGYVFTLSFQGGDATKDSNMNPATGKSDCRTLSSGQNDNTVDAGAYKPTPGLEITKSVDKSFVLPGGLVTYTYLVKNTNGVTINNIKVVDDNGTPGFPGDDFLVGTIAGLAPGASQEFTFTEILPQQMCMMINGVSTVVGNLSTTVLPSGDIQVTYVQQNVNDNRYGTGATAATGWSRSQSFNNLVGSDKAQFQFADSKGNVVLDFYVDYISASSTFPSGYGSLGVNGGEGKMVVGSATNVLSATTSLSENLKKSQFQTGYLVNSPSETVPLSGVSVPAGWDYNNSYTVVVSKKAFGTNGFGRVSIPAVHDSPPKIGSSNLITPTNCNDCVINVAVATGTAGGVNLTARATAQVCFGTPPPPELSLIKTADKTVLDRTTGGSVTYRYTVKNTGGQTITNITVRDDNGTSADTRDDFTVGTIASLAPKASNTLTATRNLTPPDQTTTMCMVIDDASTVVGNLSTTVLPSGDIQVTYVQQNVNDNRYGTGATAATGWSRSQSFNNLVGSDKAQFQFADSKGNVVLDFYVDYISASSTFPSGYGSLGVNGGEGKMNVGSAANILSATTSLSENLKKSQFQTGYLVNSPSETVPLSGVSVPAGWDYNNSYTVVVSKNAFGANGFGKVSVPSVHDSPPKIGSSNLITPTNCNDDCVVNVAVATGTAGGVNLMARATAQVCFEMPPPPELSLIKTADKTVLDRTTGGSVTYRYTVKNTGGQTITNITVRDDNGTSTDTRDDFTVGTIASLAPNASNTLTATRNLTPPDQTTTMCMVIDDASTVVGNLSTTVLPSGDIQVTYVQQNVNDNRYGTGATAATGWSRSQPFNNLVGSDKAQFQFVDSKGNVVLDFYVDYISASSTFPSGYGSLGVNGDEGKMNVGGASNVLSATTSLSENLKKSQFQTGYLVNSPTETAPLSGVSVPAGWDYNNSYTVVVSKNAFGANGFGKVSVPSVHDSPPKIGSSNLITPTNCNDDCVVNVAVATGTAGGVNLTARATAQVCFEMPPPPELSLIKTADKTVLDRTTGGSVTYRYTVKNTGGQTITNITVRDDNGTSTDTRDDFTVGTIASLAPNASNTLTATRNLTPPDQTTMCMVINGVSTVVGNLSTTVLPSGDIQVTYIQQNVNDNRYGTGATVETGWSRSQPFNNLVGSDKAQFQFVDSKGNVVLDFYVDYISASSTFPSGYGSLGVNGGEGKMNVGGASNVLSATTSLSENLKKSQFQTGYLVNSPTETAPLSGVSVPAGWDYNNSYTVVVSKNAFGANGFGKVSVPSVHDSPPKIGSSNLITPTNCNDDCVVNVAVATGTAGGVNLMARATAQVCFEMPPPPELSLIKTADKTVLDRTTGGSVTYRYTVKNTGGQTITNITVRDDNGTSTDTNDDFTVGTIASLAPKASNTLTATRNLTPPDQTTTMCMVIDDASTVVGNLSTTVLPSGDIQVTYVQQNVNDNRYGTGATAATGWSRSQPFNNLVGSDKAQFQFVDSKGNVVLDFYVDYISASSTFPSGYGSLGVNGGEGKMNVGGASNVLSATTSLSENLKKSQFQTGYLVNSPSETTPLSGVSVPAGWDYNNSYTVVVSKKAFGTNGFGRVSIPAVHDSPPKIGSSNLITPTNCDDCVVNVAVATGTAGGVNLTARATAQVCFEMPPPPELSLIKTADKTVLDRTTGGSVTYRYTVKNTGGQTITNITVRDDNGTSADTSDDFTVGTIASLAPNASNTLTATRNLTPPDQTTMCMVINGVSTVVGNLSTTVLPSGDIQVTYVQQNVNDNRYGTGATAATGWSRSQPFNNLVGSDKAQFQFVDSKGKVVLDFYVDYISASSTFPSGYGSLGVNGGEGKMNVGGASNVLSATTSLSENLKKSQFQTGYLVNSPSETIPLSGVSVPAGWDYNNSYTVVVSKHAFGTNGFGGVSVPSVHDSPPKIGSSNLITPTNCNDCVVNVAIATGTAGGVNLTARATATVCFGASLPPQLSMTSLLPNGVMNAAYTGMLTAINGTSPYTWSIINGTLPSGLRLDTKSGAITGTPSATGTFNFTVQVIDSSNPIQTASQSFTITITSMSVPVVVTIWSGTTVPGLVDAGADSAVELGVKFKSDVAGTINGIRFYKATANTGTHVGNLWTSTGTLLATATFVNETASGWQQVLFATPVTIASNAVYVASYHVNSGHYSADGGYFVGKGVDNPPLHALADGVSGGNGVYAYGSSSAFPNQSYNAANYWVDVMFQPGSPLPSPTLMSITVTPANSSLSIGALQQFTATGTYSDGRTQNVTSQATWSSSNAGVATMNSSGLATGVSTGITTISATLTGVVGATTLTVQSSSVPTVVTIWPDTTVPGRLDGGADNPVELGVKFRADVNGTINGIRFYKATANTGTHVGNLWTSTGTLLATATFVNETASGWQQVLFATPVTIASNAVYVASYHVNSGHYSADGGYFVGKGVDNPPLHALADGVSGGNGVYAYGSSSAFPNQSYNAANYWVDVMFQPESSLPPPTLMSITVTPANSSLSIGALQQFTATGTYSDGRTQNVTSQATWSSSNAGVATMNSSGLATGVSTGITTISATLTGVIGATTLTVQSSSVPTVVTIWPDTTVPGRLDGGADNPVELGVKFRADVNGTINGIRFYKATANTGTHVGNLWTSTGTLLATATFVNETASGWQQVLFATPVTIASNAIYVASYHVNSGHYSADGGYFVGKGVDNPPLHALADGVSGGNGVYAYGSSSAFPNQSYNAANYWVDVMFQPESSLPPPTLMSITVMPANSSLSIGALQQFTATGTYSDGRTQNVTSQATWSSSNAGVATMNSSGLAIGVSTGITTISATLTGVIGATMLTVQSSSVPTVVTIWPDTTVPGRLDGGADNPVELGVKFRADVNGTINGIRFYKATANTGTHVGNLWTSTGILLATATFVNETASGWQQVLFATPVTIASNAIYVASYHVNSGHYSADGGYFVGKGVDNPPLHALADGVSGGNGVYAYGSSSAFPNQSYNAANYWVDVMFQPEFTPTSITLIAGTSTEAAADTGGGNVERWPSVWTSGDFSNECGASNLVDGNTNTMWIGNVGGAPWRMILDLGTVTNVTGIQVMFQDAVWTNMGIIASRDSEVWFDYLAETNEWAPLRYLYINFWGDEHGVQPPAIREIIWRDR